MAAFYRENDSGMTCDFMASWIQNFLNSARLPQHDVRTRRESFGLPLLFISFRHVQVISRWFRHFQLVSRSFSKHFPALFPRCVAASFSSNGKVAPCRAGCVPRRSWPWTPWLPRKPLPPRLPPRWQRRQRRRGKQRLNDVELCGKVSTHPHLYSITVLYYVIWYIICIIQYCLNILKYW